MTKEKPLAAGESFPRVAKCLRLITAHGEACSVSGDAGDVFPASIAGECNSNEHDLAHDEGEAACCSRKFP